jgi:signal peptidase I
MTATAANPPRRRLYSPRLIALAVAGLVVGVLGLFGIRIFLLQPFSTPSGSMAPTLVVGDNFFVSKYAYGYSRFSLPFSPPLFDGRIFGIEPRRGDVAVFRLPSKLDIDYVKRIVGLPGDRIQMKDGVLFINDAAVQRERADDFTDDETGQRVRCWRMTLPGGVSYLALDLQDNGPLDNTNVFTVPAGHYFMLGDNLDNSADSRVLNHFGYVPFENLVGRAEFIFYSVLRRGKEPAEVRTWRIGQRIR